MKRGLAWVICFTLLVTGFSADAFALKSTAPADVSRTAHIKGLLAQLGSGQDALVAVRLKDKSVVSGFLAEMGPQSFRIVDPDSRTEHSIAYTQLTRFQGYNIATGAEAHHGLGLRAKLLGALQHVLPAQPAPRNNLTAGKTLLVGVVIGIIVAIVVAKAV